MKQSNLDRYVYSELHPRFDGGENAKKWEAHGFPKGAVPDQYVRICRGNAINLHLYRLGTYPKCNRCEFKKGCWKSATIAYEQAGL
jgi:hypothetical protein